MKKKIKIIDEEHKYELITEWLSSRGLSSGDVMNDEEGEYVIEGEVEGEDEDGSVYVSKGRKVYLPEELQSSNVQF